MRKITLLIAVLIGFALNAQIYYQIPPQMGNPGGLNADDEQPTVPGATSIQASSATPVWSPTQTIPFPFQFNSQTETQFKISTTGVLTFTTSATTVPGVTPASLPSSDIPDKSIVVWGTEGVGANDNIATKVYGTAPNRQLWIMLLSFTSRNATGSNWSYYSIVLEEGSNAIYVVDQRLNLGNGTDGQTIGVQINGTTAYQVAGSPNVTHLSQDDPTAIDNQFYTFMPGPQPMYDAKGNSITNNDELNTSNAPFTLTIDVTNLGTQFITSADVNYSINGAAPVTANATGLSIGTFASGTVNHPTTWNPTVGVYEVEMWLSNINGNADANPGNDKVRKEIIVGPGLTVKYPLYETFTSSTCPPCTPANATMEQIFGSNPGDYVSLKYQQNFPGTGDPYFTQEALDRRGYYAVNSIPRVEIDGGWDQNGNSLTQAVFNQFKQAPAFIDLSATYSISGQTVSTDITIDPLANIPSPNLRLFVAIKEKKTTQNIKNNGETEFFQVFKKFASSAQGDALNPLTSGTVVNRSVSYTFNGSYILPPDAGSPVDHSVAHTVEEFSDLAVAVWIQDITTKRIYQAAEATLVIGIEDFDAKAHNLKVYPNPAQDIAYVSIDMVKDADAQFNVVNALGQVVLSKTDRLASGTNRVDLSTSSLASGIYFVKVEIDGAIETIKLTVH